MRFSATPGDSGYLPFRVLLGKGKNILVFLDDVEQTAATVVTADDAEGFVERVVIDRDGNAAVKDGRLVTERCAGKVRFEITDIARAHV